MKIAITGGHHTTAFAVLDELSKKVPLEVSWFGHRYSMWGDKVESAEFQEVTRRAYRFIDLKAGKVYRTFNPLKLVRLPLGFLLAFFYLLQERPVLIFSFGGYLAPPVVVAGWVLGIPAVTHEQTVTVGMANRFLKPFVKVIFVSWKQSAQFLNSPKVYYSGNPVRKALFEKSEALEQELKRGFSAEKKTLYITGGKQGAHLINEVVKEVLEPLLEEFNVIHQCGSSSLHQDYQRLLDRRKALPSDLRGRYVVKPFFGEGEIGTVYDLADIVAGRAGANTVCELLLLGKVALLIPIPWLPLDEQTKNAALVKNAGLGEILPERKLSGDRFLEALSRLRVNYETYHRSRLRAKKMVVPDASKKIVSKLEEIFPGLLTAS